MKKIKFPLYSIIALCIALLPAIFIFTAHVLLNEGIYLYTGLSDLNTEELIMLAFFLGLTLLVSAIIVFLFKNFKKKWINIIVAVVLVLVSSAFYIKITVPIAVFAPKEYIELVSDDRNHHIVIAEDCYLFSPYGGDIYERTSARTMRKLESYIAETNLLTPFSDGKYTVKWNPENFELFYDSDGDGELDQRILVEYLR